MNQHASGMVEPAVYTREQAVNLFETHNSSEATLYRKARLKEIQTYLPLGRKRGVTFDKGDVDAVLSALSPSYKSAAQHVAMAVSSHQSGLSIQNETVVTN